MGRLLVAVVFFWGCAPEPVHSQDPPPVAPRAAGRTAPGAVPASAPDALPPGPWDEELTLAESAFTTPGPGVYVHAPPGFDPRAPLDLVVFLHGWTGCVRVLVQTGDVRCAEGTPPQEGWGLRDTFDATGSRALLVVPQLAWRARDGSPGRFLAPEGFRRFVAAVLGALRPRLGERTPDSIRSTTLLPHSAGFETALAIVRRGGVRVDHVVLFDALYRGVDPFLAWVQGDTSRRLVSFYTGAARTASQSRRLGVAARRELGAESVSVDEDASLSELLCAHRVVVRRAHAPHARVPERHLAEVMEALAPSRRAVCSSP